MWGSTLPRAVCVPPLSSYVMNLSFSTMIDASCPRSASTLKRLRSLRLISDARIFPCTISTERWSLIGSTGQNMRKLARRWLITLVACLSLSHWLRTAVTMRRKRIFLQAISWIYAMIEKAMNPLAGMNWLRCMRCLMKR